MKSNNDYLYAYFEQVADLELRNKDRKDIVHQLTSDLAKQKDG